jgi:hypothetical protein
MAALTVDNTTTHVVESGLEVFLQQQEGNTWQAENVSLATSGLADSTTGKLPVTYVDWGDNLSKDPSTTQKIRVETALLQDVTALPDATPAAGATATTGMTGYLMQQVGTTSGQDEMWGVVATGGEGAWVATEQQRTGAFVYTGHACLTIERIDQATVVAWDATDRAWTDAGNPVCIGEGADGPGAYGAEVTISGGITYGYVWDASTLDSGLYRLTFSLKPESGVDLADAVFPPVVPEEPEKTAVVTAEAEAEEGGGSSPANNVPVIVPELNLSYLDVGLNFARGKPTRPVNLTSTPGEESMALAWAAPVSSGASGITAYIVRATRNDTGSTLTVEVPAGTLGHTFKGLVGGKAYTFGVKAVNASGASDETTVIATPLLKTPVVTPPANNPVANNPAAGTAPGQVVKAVTVKASAVSGKSKVKVNVNPNMGKGYWSFQFEKKSGAVYKLLPKVYKTQGAAEKLTVNLKKGTYRAVVLPKYGYAGATSNVVTLKR